MDERRAGPAPAEREGPEREQVLAALRRAMLHRRPCSGPAPLWLLLEHLAIPRRSPAARRVRTLLRGLERDGMVQTGREHGVTVWSLTAAGGRGTATAPGEPGLPESPRRRNRRSARRAAAEELPRFRARLAATLAEAEAMLDATPAPGSEAWLDVGRRLAADCRRIGSAWHCLHEWPEPPDDLADPDAACEARRARLAALRNVRLWREED